MVQNDKLISIISPVFNTKKYLTKLIRSIESQTYENWELIFIEDCGSDDSYQYLCKKALNNSRIKVFQNEKNLGVDITRFKGIDLASGEYIMFVDSDDWLPKNSLEKLYRKLNDEKADIVYGSFMKVLDRFGILKKNAKNNYGIKNITESVSLPRLFDEYYISYFGVNKLLVSMWGKLYRKEILDKAKLSPSGFKMGEDLIFNLNLHPFLNKIAFVEDVIYFYRWGGMTNKHNPTFLEDIKKQYVIKKNKIIEYKYDLALPYIKYELINCFYSHFLNHLLINRYSKNDIRDLIKLEIHDPIYLLELEDLKIDKAKAIYNKNIDELVTKIWNDYCRIRLKYRLKRLINALMS